MAERSAAIDAADHSDQGANVAIYAARVHGTAGRCAGVRMDGGTSHVDHLEESIRCDGPTWSASDEEPEEQTLADPACDLSAECLQHCLVPDGDVSAKLDGLGGHDAETWPQVSTGACLSEIEGIQDVLAIDQFYRT